MNAVVDEPVRDATANGVEPGPVRCEEEEAMAELERDPRIDPKPGDEIARNIKHSTNGIILRKVERAHGGFVAFWANNGSTCKCKIVPLREWQKWASNNSEVVEHAGD